MENVKVIIWVLVALGVFIWQLVQKFRQQAEEARRRQPPQTARQNVGTSTRPEPRPAAPAPNLSFEELLARMQRQNQEAAAPSDPTSTAERLAEERTITEPRGRFARTQERTEVESRSLEDAAPEARSLEAPWRAPRRADTAPRASTQHGQEDYWSLPKPAPAQQTRRTLNDLLKTPADLRAAFVLSEILGRKW
ncbi:hypothetical protein KLP40_19520 [Hymenobacter sp. NST-14]|uniref:hypothetical protein n=1 Tax=Hymenobacter piscis TaxID=2839984 RepID=UPI001C028FDD|nr:hypothetical protein [Hymenobacter piscis]MBT9395364.1 hypothetical protein [Hymenobacter piscis]